MAEAVLNDITLADLPKAAKAIVKFAENFRILAFYGEMGAGKTTMIKAICKVLEVEDEVTSPTFSLVNEYHSPTDGRVFHFDFYRIEEEEEAMDIGIEEYFYSGDYCLIEWPQKIASLLPNDMVKVNIDVENGKRNINLISA